MAKDISMQNSKSPIRRLPGLPRRRRCDDHGVRRALSDPSRQSGTLEGDRTVTRAVLLEFESRARALEWYNSDEYRDLKALRQRTAKTNALVLSGYDDA